MKHFRLIAFFLLVFLLVSFILPSLTVAEQTSYCGLILTKSDNVNHVSPGDELIYFLTLINTGTAKCTGGGVLLKDYFDPYTSYIDATISPVDISSTRIEWNFGTLYPGDRRDITLTMLVSQDTPCNYILVNKAKFWSDQTGYDDYVIEETSIECSSDHYCGDGIVDLGEECDDGNNIGGDGCSAECTFELVTAPVAYSFSILTDENTPIDMPLLCSHLNENSLSYIIMGDPTNGILLGSGRIRTYIPNADYVGPDSFTYKCRDGSVDSNIAIASITVNHSGKRIFPTKKFKKIYVDKLNFINDNVRAGEDLEILLSFKSKYIVDMRKTKVLIEIPELGIRGIAKSFNVYSGDSYNKILLLNIPKNTRPGQYHLRLTINNDGEIIRTKYRPIIVKG